MNFPLVYEEIAEAQRMIFEKKKNYLLENLRKYHQFNREISIKQY
mgnify:CR=1 FL=1